MNVLGIESSCDETAAAVVTETGRVLSNVVATQIELHAPYGGVVPELAARAHLRAIVPVIEDAVSAAGGAQAIDAVAVTNGPGLVGALLTGVQCAQAYAWARGLPIVGVNHLDGHLFAGFLRLDGAPPPPPLPFVALLASGGHTGLYRVDALGETALLGQTRDDAAGEAFDKAAKLLGLGYPGGPVIDRLAEGGNPRAVQLPIPMLHRKDLDFSFSGLKTAVARHVQKHGVPGEGQAMADLCASFQRSVVEVLAKKSVAACLAEDVPHLVLGGGVAANRSLRARCAELCAASSIRLYVPPLAACTDNAAMIAYVGARRLAAGERDETLRVYSRDPERRRGRFRRDGRLIEA